MMTNDLYINQSTRNQKVAEGINIILSLFTLAKQQRIFPRNIMTMTTNGQVTVNSMEEIIEKFEEAEYQDCRINAYPAFLNEAEEKDYENGINLHLFTPNILFIDLDLNDFPTKEKLDKTLTKTQKHILKILPDSQPLVLWSGRGYHIIIPTKTSEALEFFEDFSELTPKPSEEFLRFAKSFLTLDKADRANNPSFRSCLLRVPFTFNSKCFDDDTDPEVKILQGLDITKPLPSMNNLLVEFLTFLSDRKLKRILEKDNRMKLRDRYSDSRPDRNNSIQYVEKLLTIPISDYRKNAISLIMAPYFVNVLKLSDEESFNKIRQWTLKCNDVKLLRPSKMDFDVIIKYAIKRAKQTGVKPLKFRDTLQYKNNKLFRLLSSV